MTGSPLSRRQFFGATAAAAVLTGTSPAAPVRPSPFAPEPTLPPGVCQRLGSARFRELTSDYQFSPDSRWLAQFDGRQFVGYEVATGRRAKWQAATDLTDDQFHWQMTTGGEALAVQLNGRERLIHHYDIASGRERKGKVVPFAHGQAFTADGTGLIQYLIEGGLYRLDVATGKTVWKRKWECDASVPPDTLTTAAGWLVGVGLKRLHLFDPLTGKDGPRLEDALPKDAPADNHFTLVGFSADGKRVCGWHTAVVPGRVVVWDVASGQVVGRPPHFNGCPVLSADGQHLLTPGDTGRLVGVSVKTGTVTRKLAAENVACLLLSPDGTVLVVGRNLPFAGAFADSAMLAGVVRLVNPATGELLPQSPDPSCELAGVRFADSHTVVADVPTDFVTTTSIVWDTRTGRRRMLSCSLPPFQFAGLGGAFVNELSPDATRYVSLVRGRNLLGDGEVCVTDATTGRRLFKCSAQASGASESPFWIGRGRVGAQVRDELIVWDLADGTERTIPLASVVGDTVHATAATTDGRTVALLHWDDEGDDQTPPTLTWVDISTGNLTTARAQKGQLSVSADGRRVAITAGGGELDVEATIRVTVIDRGGRSVSFRTDTGFDVFAPRAELSPCGRTAFLNHTKRDTLADEVFPVVQFWEVLSGEKRAEYATVHRADGLGVSACGRRLVTCHRDAPIYLWDVFGESTDRQAKPDAKTWDALDASPEQAFAAIRRLVQHPATAVELLSAKLTPAEPLKAEWVKARIDHLGSRDFRTRHAAELELSAVADRTREELRKALDAGAENLEAEERLQRLIDRSAGVPRAAWRAVRAVEALEYCEGKAAGELLKKLADGVESAVLTREAAAAMNRKS